MTLSNGTIERMKAAAVKVKEFMDFFHVPEDRAWVMVADNDARCAAETAMAIQRRQDKIALAEKRALAARAATYSANIAEEDDKGV